MPRFSANDTATKQFSRRSDLRRGERGLYRIYIPADLRQSAARAIEEDWTPKDLGENFAVAALGSVFGSVLTAVLLFLAMRIFLPRNIFPEHLSTAAMTAAFPYGPRMLLLGLLGTLACLGGAAVETALSGAYNLCQFLNRPWGKNLPVKAALLYTASWIGSIALATLIVLTGARPLTLVNISVVFGMVIMPLRTIPFLRLPQIGMSWANTSTAGWTRSWRASFSS